MVLHTPGRRTKYILPLKRDYGNLYLVMITLENGFELDLLDSSVFFFFLHSSSKENKEKEIKVFTSMETKRGVSPPVTITKKAFTYKKKSGS